MNIYLDYNASAPLRPESRVAMIEAMNMSGNASSIHYFGRQMRKTIDHHRRKIADYFETDSSNIIFTSGATEANNLALCGFKGRVIVSAIEHDSVDQARKDRYICPVTAQGVIDLKSLEALIDGLLKDSPEPIIISVMAANNETGIIQPVDDIVSLARRKGVFTHCDAVQAIGRVRRSWRSIDLLSISAHKAGGPQGAGALINQTGIPLEAQLRGGGQERFLRAGTGNPVGIAGFAAAIHALEKDDWLPVENLRTALEAGLEKQCPDIIIPGKDVERLPNTTVLIMKGVKSATQVMNFDLAGIAVSAGAACSSGKIKSSRILKNMGFSQDQAECSLRVSLGLDNPVDLIERFTRVWLDMRNRSPMTVQ
jgi:cysteine desulfurase